jgi:hypothetical protein
MNTRMVEDAMEGLSETPYNKTFGHSLEVLRCLERGHFKVTNVEQEL